MSHNRNAKPSLLAPHIPDTGTHNKLCFQDVMSGGHPSTLCTSTGPDADIGESHDSCR